MTVTTKESLSARQWTGNLSAFGRFRGKFSRQRLREVRHCKAACSSETSDDFEQAVRRYIPEDSTLYPQTYSRSHSVRPYKAILSASILKTSDFAAVSSDSFRCGYLLVRRVNVTFLQRVVFLVVLLNSPLKVSVYETNISISMSLSCWNAYVQF